MSKTSIPALTECVHTASFILDVDREILDVSDELYTILGYDPGELPVDSSSDLLLSLLSKHDFQDFELVISECMELGNPLSRNLMAKTKTGEAIQIYVTVTPFVRDGKVAKVIGTLAETPSHEPQDRPPSNFAMEGSTINGHEKELQEKDELFRLISDNSIDLLWAYDLHTGKYTYSSPSVTRICGRTQNEMLQLGLFDVLTPESAQRAAIELQTRIKAIEDGDENAISSGIYGFDELRKDGSVFQSEVMVSLVRNRAGHVTGVVGITRDVTERLKNERKQLEFERNLFVSQKRESIGRIATGIANQLNHALKPIIEYTEYLKDPNLVINSDEQRTLLGTVSGAALRAKDLLNQLLDLNQLQSHEFRPIDLNGEVKKCEPLLRGFLRDDINICFWTVGDLPLVHGDSAKIRQVVMNLATNAQDAMPEGGTITIETKLVDYDKDQTETKGVLVGRYVELVVSDTGTGVSPDILPFIFEPFFTTRHSELKSGLGLSSVMGIVKQHKGYIDVDSHIGKGSKFTVTLPIYAGEMSGSTATDADPGHTETTPRAEELADRQANRDNLSSTAFIESLSTELELRETRLRAALEAERQAGELQHRFLTMISHEYRTPLAVISTNLDILELQNSLHQINNSVELNKMRRAVHRLVEVMDISLGRGRLYDPKTKAEFRHVPIKLLISSQIEDIRTIWPERIFNYNDGLEDDQVFGDAQYLKTAFFNLLDNAQKYSPANTPVNIMTLKEDHGLVIRIFNKGQMGKEECDLLFGKYIRGKSSNNTSGAGIGLWLVREIIEQHNGSVALENGEDGIAATVRLPLSGFFTES
ncbi:MAG: PAS domain S-box protein [Chlorobiaceae bacterium]|nr:PAS domain S-box protein [Chlorobiaceae bacterium]